MNAYDKLLLSRHLEAAARTYEEKARNLIEDPRFVDGDFNRQADVVSGCYYFLARDARRLKEELLK